MHETRNFILVLVSVGAVCWAFYAWLFVSPESGMFWVHRIGSTVIAIGSCAWLAYALLIEDKLPNYLRATVGNVYYEADGVSFLPMIKTSGNRVELCVYYQNRFENPAEVVVHLRPPEDGFIIRPGMRDVHFAFRALGGDFGAIHQPIGIPERIQGEVLDIKVAAASHYPRSHGARWRRGAGIPCGAPLVDWGGAAFKSGVHEVSGELELVNPVSLHMSMPQGVKPYVDGTEEWTHERVHAGPAK